MTITRYVLFPYQNMTKIFENSKRVNRDTLFSIPSYYYQEYNVALKQRARSKSKERTEKVKEYCKKAMPENDYLRLANERDEEEVKENAYFLYFDFYYSFLYCQVPKVIFKI